MPTAIRSPVCFARRSRLAGSTPTSLRNGCPRAYAAQTFADLEPLTGDLPDEAAAVPVPGGFQVGRAPQVQVLAGDHGRVKPRRQLGSAQAVPGIRDHGRVKIDLRDATFAERAADIHAIAIMGAVTIIVPEGLPVEVSGLGLMGSVDSSVNGPGVPGAPLVRVSGLALMGGIGAQRRRRKHSPGDGDPSASLP